MRTRETLNRWSICSVARERGVHYESCYPLWWSGDTIERGTSQCQEFISGAAMTFKRQLQVGRC